MLEHRTCLQCGRAFAVKSYVVALGKGRFCSAPCHYAWRSTQPSPKLRHLPKPCPICGTVFRDSHAQRQTCSKPCGYALKRRRVRQRAEEMLGEPLAAGLARRMAEGATMREICNDCGISDDRVVKRMMTELGIATRTPREAVLMQWIDNPERRAETGRRFSEYAHANPETVRAQSVAANLKLQSTSPTSIERALMTALDADGIVYEFQYIVGGKFLCDFGFPDVMLIVEADGSYWHRTPLQKARDASKDAYLRACGYTVLRVTDHDIIQRLDWCRAQIQSHLAKWEKMP